MMAVLIGVVSLSDLLDFDIRGFVQLTTFLREKEGIFGVMGAKNHNDVMPSEKDTMKQLVALVGEFCEQMSLRASRSKWARILSDDDYGGWLRSWGNCHAALKDLRERIEDELDGEKFLHLDQASAGRFTNPRAGWETVCQRFPKAAYNIEECSRCYALERYGAAVFHVMQVAEYGVIQVADLLGVSGDKPGWASLKRLADLIKEPFPKRLPEAQKHSKLLEHVIPLTRGDERCVAAQARPRRQPDRMG